MKNLGVRGALLTTSILALPVVGAPAFGASPDGIPEIIVTAQRRSESVLSVPMSIQAISGNELKNSGIIQVSDLGLTTPGYTATLGTGFVQIFLRGVGNSVLVGTDPSVAMYVDDVPRVFGSMSSNLVDVERVEVLKGAQGGLYGRNATGGVVNIITRQPSTEKIAGTIKASYAEKNTRSASGYINVPLGDKAAFSIALQGDKHDAYVKNIAPVNPYTAAMFPSGSFVGNGATTAAFLNSGVQHRNDYQSQDFWAGDAKLLLKPSDDFKITLAGDINNKRDTMGNGYMGIAPAYAQANLVGFMRRFGITAVLPPGFILGNLPKFTVAQATYVPTTLLDYGGSATAVWNGPGFDLTSISAYRVNNIRNDVDIANANVPFIFSNSRSPKSYFYQEVRALSTSAGRFSWLGGGTYLHKKSQSRNRLGYLLPLVQPNPNSSSQQIIDNWSIYAQVGYDFAPAWNLTVSGRYVHEKNVGTYTFPVVPGGTAVEKKFLPSATISYKLENGGNAYARWARGFKAGGINVLVSPAVLTDPTHQGAIFAGETVDTYEAGVRTPLFDRQAQFTASVFYNDYKNLQVSTTGNATHPEIILAIVNAGSARTYGAEGTFTWRVIDPLTVGITAGYLNAKYKSFKVVDATVLTPFDRSGHLMLNSPKFQFSFTAAVDQPLNDAFRLVGNVLVSHHSKSLFAEAALPGITPNSEQPGYWLVNARLGVRTSDDKYELAVFANNLFNRGYFTSGSTSSLVGGSLGWGNPRIVGGEISVRF